MSPNEAKNAAQRDKIRRRMQAYQHVFEGEDGAIVLEELERFCYAKKPTFAADDPNGRVQAFREGRREVWLRIQEYLTLTDVAIEELRG